MHLRLDALENSASGHVRRPRLWRGPRRRPAASRGWNVVAIENDARFVAAAAAERHGVMTSEAVEFKLNETAEVFRSIKMLIENERWGDVRVVYAVRYLHKPSRGRHGVDGPLLPRLGSASCKDASARPSDVPQKKT